MFKHGQAVTLTDSSGVTHVGTLHLPDVTMYGNGTSWPVEQWTFGGYAVHTILRDDGSRFRTEGRLSRN